jgi:hypothetical protein
MQGKVMVVGGGLPVATTAKQLPTYATSRLALNVEVMVCGLFMLDDCHRRA